MSQLTTIISSVLGIDETQVTPELSKDAVVSWDSLNAIILLTEVEHSFGIKFPFDEGLKVQSVNDIRALLQKQGKDPDA